MWEKVGELDEVGRMEGEVIGRDCFMEIGAEYRAVTSRALFRKDRVISWLEEKSLGWRVSNSCEVVFWL